jgi:hypothetical protein
MITDSSDVCLQIFIFKKFYLVSIHTVQVVASHADTKPVSIHAEKEKAY